MPVNVFGNSSNNSENKIDSTVFVQKPFLRTTYLESNREDIDLKNQYKIENLPDPISIPEAASKKYVDNKFNDPRILKNTAHVDFNDKNLDNVRFVKVNCFPIPEHLTAKIFVDLAISEGVVEPSLLKLDRDENLRLDGQYSILFNNITEDDN